MMKESNVRKEQPISGRVSIISLLLIVAAIVFSLKLGCGTQFSVLCGSIVSIVIALLLHTKLSDIITSTLKCISDCAIAVLILLLVGSLIGIWLIGGSIPTLIYYCLSYISPKAIVPLSFVLCALTSIVTGTSFGSLATIGLVVFGVGTSMGISGPMMVGAIVSGAFFGDKMSPMSDTTNLASAISGTDLYSHIGSMLYTTVPATIITLFIYLIMGFKYNESHISRNEVSGIMNVLSDSFNINVWCLVPMLLLLVLSAIRVPSITAMLISLVASITVAMATQECTLAALSACVMNGYSSQTGLSTIDAILSRGGVVSVMGSVTIVYFSALMTGSLNASGIMDSIKDLLFKTIKTRLSLIASTLATSYGVLLMTGNQMLGIVIPGQMLKDMYDEYDTNRKVLSRTLEDASTLGSAIVPWSAAFAYIHGVFGIGASYIPYACLCYIVPFFSLAYALTGWGLWDRNGNKLRNRTKGVDKNH